MISFRLVVILIVLSMVSACAMKRPLEPETARDNIPTDSSVALLVKAENCLARADTATRLYTCRDQYLSVIELNPGDYTALARLSTIDTLTGTAYTERRAEKKALFAMAMGYAEQAMMSNPAFRLQIENGAPLWEAITVLGEPEVEAMFYWVTALQYAFQEGMSMPARIINVSWLKNGLRVLNHIEKVAPGFGGGSVEFGQAICYLVLPESLGGSKNKGTQLVQKAVSENPDFLLPRWGRAKYYYEIMNEPEKRRQEIEWVASRNPADFNDLFPWRVHFVDDAQKIMR